MAQGHPLARTSCGKELERVQAKVVKVSADFYTKEDVLNRRYSDDVISKDSRSTSQSESLLRGVQSEPLRRAHKVCFLEPEGSHEARRRLSSITCSGGAGVAMDYTNLAFEAKTVQIWTLRLLWFNHTLRKPKSWQFQNEINRSMSLQT